MQLRILGESDFYESWGNGSAMRVSSIAYLFDSEDEVLYEAMNSAIPTHYSSEGIKGAQAIALSIYLARTGKTKGVIKKAIEGQFGYNLDRTIDEVRETYVFDTTCVGSVPEAII